MECPFFQPDAPISFSGVTPKERPKRCRVGSTRKNPTYYDPSYEEKKQYCESENFEECKRFKNRPLWQKRLTK